MAEVNVTAELPVEEPTSHGTHIDPEYAVLFIFSGLFLGAATRHLTDVTKIPVPYTVILLVLGCGFGALANAGLGVYGEAVELVSDIDPHLFLAVFLPMLIFESAFSLSWHTFKHSLGHALLLAIPGLLVATALTGVVIKGLLQTSWTWAESLMLGSLLSATDPVAVVALLREVGASPKLGTLIEGESLLNDGTAIVMFNVFSDIVKGGDLSGGEVVKTLLQLSIGGPALGLAWALVTIWWISRVVNDPFVEITITFCSAYLLFFVAETLLHVSGVLALVVLGGAFAAFGRTQISVHVEHSLHQFWSTITYHGNTLVFLLAGVIMAQQISFDTFSAADYGDLVLLWVLLMLIRVVLVALLWPFLRSDRLGYKLSPKGACVLIWGALRGAVALALALIVALDTEEIEQDVRDYVLFYASGIAFLTLTINASTTGLLLKFLQLSLPSELQLDMFPVNLKRLDRISRREMESLAKDKTFTGCNWRAVEERIFTKQFHNQVEQYLGFNPYGEEASTEDRFTVQMLAMRAGIATAAGGGLTAVVNLDDHAVEEAHDEVAKPPPTPNCFRRTAQALSRWFNEHDEHSVSRLAEAKKDARERFLNSTKSIYWQRYHDGYLPGSAVPVLMQAAERAEDASAEPLNEWADTLHGFTRIAEALVKGNCRGGSKALSLAINVASQFIYAQDRALKLLIDSLYNLNLNGVDDDVARILTEESKANVRKAHAFMTKTREEYPNIYVATQSRLAASLLLEHRDRFIDKFSKYGLFTTREAELLKSSVRHAEKELQLHDAPIEPPDARSIVRRSWLFAGVPDDVFERCWGISEKKLYPEPGSLVIERGCSNLIGIHCVVRGTAMYQTQARPEPDLLPAGTLFGVAETLSCIPGLLGVTAHSNLETVFFDADRFRAVMQSVPEKSRLRHNFMTLTTFQLVYMHWPELYRVTHPEANRVPYPDKSLIQNELTKDFMDTEFEEGMVFHLYYPSLLVRGAVSPLSNAGLTLSAMAVLSPNHSYRVQSTCLVIQFPNLATSGGGGGGAGLLGVGLGGGGGMGGGAGQYAGVGPGLHMPTEDYSEPDLEYDMSDSEGEPEWAELHRETSTHPPMTPPPPHTHSGGLTVPVDTHSTHTPLGRAGPRVTMNTGAKSFHNDFDGLMDIFEDSDGAGSPTNRRRAASMGSGMSSGSPQTTPATRRRNRAVSYAPAMIHAASSEADLAGRATTIDLGRDPRRISDGVTTLDRQRLTDESRQQKTKRAPRIRSRTLSANFNDDDYIEELAPRRRPVPKQVSKLKSNGGSAEFHIQGISALPSSDPPSPNPNPSPLSKKQGGARPNGTAPPPTSGSASGSANSITITGVPIGNGVAPPQAAAQDPADQPTPPMVHVSEHEPTNETSL